MARVAEEPRGRERDDGHHGVNAGDEQGLVPRQVGERTAPRTQVLEILSGVHAAIHTGAFTTTAQAILLLPRFETRSLDGLAHARLPASPRDASLRPGCVEDGPLLVAVRTIEETYAPQEVHRCGGRVQRCWLVEAVPQSLEGRVFGVRPLAALSWPVARRPCLTCGRTGALRRRLQRSRDNALILALGGLGPQLLDLLLHLPQRTLRRRLSHELLPMRRGTVLQELAAGSGGHDDLHAASLLIAPAVEQLAILHGAPDSQVARRHWHDRPLPCRACPLSRAGPGFCVLRRHALQEEQVALLEALAGPRTL